MNSIIRLHRKIYSKIKRLVFLKFVPRASLIIRPKLFLGNLGESKTIFVLGHQRSGSTVLAHILNTNPDICGYTETHFSYRHYSDIRKLWAFIRKYINPSFAPDQYIALDKLVDHLTILSPKVLLDKRIRFIFIVREPRSTLASFVHTFIKSLSDAEHVYLLRMGQLQHMATFLFPDRAFFVNYDDLIHRTGDVLQRLTSFLQLSTPLLPTYTIGHFSGRGWYGDPTRAILEGEIKNIPELPCDIPHDVLERCQQAYVNTLTTLQMHCTTI